jgi:hypothetical protein
MSEREIPLVGAHGGSFRVTVLFIYSNQVSILPVKTRLPILNRKH